MNKKYYLILSQKERDEIDEFTNVFYAQASNAFNKIKSLLITECWSEVYNPQQYDPAWVSWKYMIPYDLIFEIGEETAMHICTLIKKYDFKHRAKTLSIKKLLNLYDEVNKEAI